jgi:hypothetical protein
MMKWTRVLRVGLLIGVLTGCAGQGGVTPAISVHSTPEEALRDRATQLWEARVKGDLVTQYRLLEPKAQEEMTLTGFVRARGTVQFLSYTIEEVEVAENQGQVKATTKFRLNLAIPQVSRLGPYDHTVYTRWVLHDGHWYLKADQQDVGKPLKAETGPS